MYLREIQFLNYMYIIIMFICGSCCAGFRLRHQHSFSHLRFFEGRYLRDISAASLSDRNSSEITAQVGGSALMDCFIEAKGDEMVTWMKLEDERLLTAGLQVYSSESRYKISNNKQQKLWNLRINKVQVSDAGNYECQLTTHPPITTLISLNVVEAYAMISGPKEIHVRVGSSLLLNCQVINATEPVLYIFWFHNGTMVNFAFQRPLTVVKYQYASTLSIKNVSKSDEGVYRCEPSYALSDNITLHVLTDENSAAMQRGSDKKSRDNSTGSNGNVQTSEFSSDAMCNSSSILFILISIMCFSLDSKVILFCLNGFYFSTWRIITKYLSTSPNSVKEGGHF